MFLIVRFIRRLLALPFGIAAGAAGLFSPAISARLHRIVWSISPDGHAGQLALAGLIRSAGPTVACAEAREMMRRRPSAEVASFAGLLEADCGNTDEARACLNAANELGGDRDGLTELLAYRLDVGRATDAEQAGRLIERLARRRDLSPTVSKLALEGMMWRALTGGDLDDARGRATHLLAVADNPQAEIVMGALHQRDGRAAVARACFARSSPLPAAERLYYRCVAVGVAGSADDLAEALAALKAEDAELGVQMESRLAGGGRLQ